MKNILFIGFTLLVMGISAQAGIVNNSGTKAADSISISFFLLDSLGNLTDIASGDSIFITTYYPSGAVAYKDSGAYNDGRITTGDISGYNSYSFKMDVQDIDGTGVNGIYTYVFIVKDMTGADLATAFRGVFQLYTSEDINILFDSLGSISDDNGITSNKIATDAIGANELASNAAAEIADSVGVELVTLRDSMQYLFDSLNNVYDSLALIIDSLQSQDNWVAKETTLGNVRDTVYVIMDSLNSQDDWIFAKTDSAYLKDSSISESTIKGDAITKIIAAMVDSLLLIEEADTISGDYLLTKFLFYAHIAGDTSATSPWLNKEDIAAALTDSIINMQPSDTLSGTLLGQLVRELNYNYQKMDSILWASSYGLRNNAITNQVQANDSDYVFFRIGTDTAFQKVYYHIGGSPGDAPDSTKVVTSW